MQLAQLGTSTGNSDLPGTDYPSKDSLAAITMGFDDSNEQGGIPS